MPICATPVEGCGPQDTGGVSVIACEDQNVKAPSTTELYREPLYQRMKAIHVSGGQLATIRWTMVDVNGHPVDLTTCLDAAADSSSSSSSGSSMPGVVGTPVAKPQYVVKLRIREHIARGRKPLPAQMEYDATIVDAANGVVEVSLPRGATVVPGVYFGEMAVVIPEEEEDDEESPGIVASDAVEEDDLPSGNVIFSNIFYVIISRGMWSTRRHGPGGPPTVPEIRLHLRDSDPRESFLLDNLRFDDAELALAITRPVEYWNETPPDLGRVYTTQSFPWRYHWLEAICANLFWMAAERFRANNLQYSAAGVQVNDQDKELNYERAAQRRDAEWKNFVRRKKSEINLNSAYGGVGSGYQYGGYGVRGPYGY